MPWIRIGARNKPIRIWSFNITQEPWGKDSLAKMVMGNLDSPMRKNATGPLSYTKIQKTNSKWISLNRRPGTIKSPEENIQAGSSSSGSPKAKTNKWICIQSKGNKQDYIKLTGSSAQRNHQQNEKATYRMGQNMCQSRI